MLFETENLKVEYSRGNILDLGEMRGLYSIVHTVNIIEKMTFKKPVVFNDREELVLDRRLIDEAKKDFYEKVKREIFPRPVFRELLPILEVKLPPLQECNYSEIGAARRIILGLMGLLAYDGDIPEGEDYVWRIDHEMCVECGWEFETVYPFHLNGRDIYKCAAMPRISD